MKKLDRIIRKILQEGDTYEKMAAKGKKAGNLKQGTVRKRLGIPKDKKIPLSKINKELSRLKKMDKDKDKKGVQLGDKNQKYYKALQLSKTLKTTTNVNENKLPDGFHSQEDINQFFSDSSNEIHYLNSKPVKDWDKYDLSNFKSLVRKAQEKYGTPDLETDYIRRRRGDYSDDMEGGMTDYQRGRMDEDMGEWPKKLTSRYSDEYRFEFDPTYEDKLGRAKYRVIDIESGELKGTPIFEKPKSLRAYADNLIKPQGGTQSSHFGTNEGTCGYGEDGKVDPENTDKLKPAGGKTSSKKLSDMEKELERLLKGVGYKSSIYSNFINEDLQETLRKNLANRLK
tara:strand:+ start:1318 stop:2340 length:1023 start_codon:yes stop_codon:yes gene_type:complete